MNEGGSDEPTMNDSPIGKTDQPPNLTAASFLDNNKGVIRYLFPDVLPPAGPQTTPHSPQTVEETVKEVTDKVWDVVSSDPNLKGFDREKFDALPPDQRLKIIDKALTLIKASRDVDDYLENNK
ncbi:hypothetical protein HY612_02320 [Candidatus Roizmanbacteria bacterium]|nr:hypothetical protein [Candidatus Roizmanbacteria bacterium]